jgi:hypothetical protein
MKKIYFLLILCLSVFSCTNEDFTDEVKSPNSSLRSADGKYRMLGFGYDVTGENLSKESLRWPVLDVDKLANEKYTVLNNPETGGDNFFYYGYSSLDYIKETEGKSGFKLTASGIDFDKLKLCGFGGNISYYREFSTKYTYSTKYSFASADIVRYVRSFNIAKSRDELSNYVTAKFLVDLKNFTPDQFVEDYGTHVLTDITIGGHLKVMYRSAIEKETDYTRKKDIVKVGLNATLKSIGLQLDVDKEVEVKETLEKENKERTLYIKYRAGDGVDVAYDLEEGTPKVVNKYAWEKSVTEQNAGLVVINWKKCYPIYDFIKDPVKKAQIKAAVERYVAKKQLEVIDIVPLYRYSKESNGQHFYTLNYSEIGNGKYDFTYDWVEAYVHREKVQGTTPLYRYYNSKYWDHVYTTNWSELGNGKYGNNFDWIEGYIYTQQIPGTVPFYRYYRASDVKHFYTTKKDELSYGRYPYIFEKIEGYVYPGNNKNY